MELRFGVNPLRSQPINKDQSGKSTKSKLSRSGKDQESVVVDKGSQKAKEVQKKSELAVGRIPKKEVEKLGGRFSFRLPVIRANISSEVSSPPANRSTPASESSYNPTIRPQENPPKEVLHIGEEGEKPFEEKSESEAKPPKIGDIYPANKALIEKKWLSKYPADMLMIDNPQKKDEGKSGKNLPKEDKNFRKLDDGKKFHLRELRPKISALTRSLNSLQVEIKIQMTALIKAKNKNYIEKEKADQSDNEIIPRLCRFPPTLGK